MAIALAADGCPCLRAPRVVASLPPLVYLQPRRHHRQRHHRILPHHRRFGRKVPAVAPRHVSLPSRIREKALPPITLQIRRGLLLLLHPLGVLSALDRPHARGHRGPWLHRPRWRQCRHCPECHKFRSSSASKNYGRCMQYRPTCPLAGTRRTRPPRPVKLSRCMETEFLDWLA